MMMFGAFKCNCSSRGIAKFNDSGKGYTSVVPTYLVHLLINTCLSLTQLNFGVSVGCNREHSGLGVDGHEYGGAR